MQLNTYSIWFFSPSNWLISPGFAESQQFTQFFVGTILLINLKISWSKYNQKYSVHYMFWQGQTQDKKNCRLKDCLGKTWWFLANQPNQPTSAETDLSLVHQCVASAGFPSFYIIKKWGKCSYNSDKLELFMMTLLWISILAEIEKFL